MSFQPVLRHYHILCGPQVLHLAVPEMWGIELKSCLAVGMGIDFRTN